MDRDDDIWERMLLWTAERSGLSRAEVDRVYDLGAEFWATHGYLSDIFMSGDDPWS